MTNHQLIQNQNKTVKEIHIDKIINNQMNRKKKIENKLKKNKKNILIISKIKYCLRGKFQMIIKLIQFKFKKQI